MNRKQYLKQEIKKLQIYLSNNPTTIKDFKYLNNLIKKYKKELKEMRNEKEK